MIIHSEAAPPTLPARSHIAEAGQEERQRPLGKMTVLSNGK